MATGGAGASTPAVSGWRAEAAGTGPIGRRGCRHGGAARWEERPSAATYSSATSAASFVPSRAHSRSASSRSTWVRRLASSRAASRSSRQTGSPAARASRNGAAAARYEPGRSGPATVPRSAAASSSRATINRRCNDAISDSGAGVPRWRDSSDSAATTSSGSTSNAAASSSRSTVGRRLRRVASRTAPSTAGVWPCCRAASSPA